MGYNQYVAVRPTRRDRLQCSTTCCIAASAPQGLLIELSLCVCRDRVLLLNKTTEVINFWQDEETKHTVEEAREKFPDCQFEGA